MERVHTRGTLAPAVAATGIRARPRCSTLLRVQPSRRIGARETCDEYKLATMPSWIPASDLFHGKRIVWQCRAGHYCAGLVHQCPVDIVMCMDDSPTHDLITADSGAVFLSCERIRGRIVDDSALNELVPIVRDDLLAMLRRPSAGAWVLAAAGVTPSLRDFAAETGLPLVGNAPELTAWLTAYPAPERRSSHPSRTLWAPPLALGTCRSAPRPTLAIFR